VANIKKIIKVAKKVTEKKKTTPKTKAPVKKKPLTPKQKTYQVRGALAKRDRELEAGKDGGKASPEFVAKLKVKTFKEIERKTGKPIVKGNFY
jgi:hypothetical protein